MFERRKRDSTMFPGPMELLERAEANRRQR